MAADEVTATELKNHCGQVLADVARRRKPIVVTRRGRPIARIVPIEEAEQPSPFGFARGLVRIHGDILAPVDVPWKAAG